MGEARSALLIGIGRYDNRDDLKPLDGPRIDVQNMRAVLEDPAVGGYKVQTLEDVDSTKACAELEDFLRDRSENETCIVYFSGHGFIDAKSSLYLCTTNASFKRPRSSTIPADFISRLIDDCQSKRVVLMLDCCYAGNYDGSAKSGDVIQPQFSGTGLGRVVLTAGAENQLAWDNGERGSIFSRHIAEGIRSGAADTDGDGRITVQELYDYVYRKVVSERPGQRPGKNTYRESGPSFLIAESRAKRVEQIPAWLHHELNSSVAETRLNALKALEDLVLAKPNTRELVLEILRKALEDDSVRVQRAAHELLIRVNNTGGANPVPLPMPPRVQPPAALEPAPKTERETGTPELVADRRTDTPGSSLLVELVLWLVFAAFGTFFGFVLPISNRLVSTQDAEFMLCANVFLIVYATFIAVRYRAVADVRAVARSYLWWAGAIALVIANAFLSNIYTQNGAELFLAVYSVLSFGGAVALSRFALRVKTAAAIGLALVMALVWGFGYLGLPASLNRYGNDRFIGVFLVNAVLVFGLGALARSRSLKSHAQ